MTDRVTAPGAFDYAAFIAEIEELVTTARDPASQPRRTDAPWFVAWRFTLEQLLTRINRTHLDVRCGITYRLFRVNGLTRDPREQVAAFDRDLADTLIELETLIGAYHKYGEPPQRRSVADPAKAVSTPPASATPPAPPAPAAVPASGPAGREWPDGKKLTILWLLHNLPLSAWGVLVWVVAGAFVLGTEWPPVHQWFKGRAAPAAAEVRDAGGPANAAAEPGSGPSPSSPAAHK